MTGENDALASAKQLTEILTLDTATALGYDGLPQERQALSSKLCTTGLYSVCREPGRLGRTRLAPVLT